MVPGFIVREGADRHRAVLQEPIWPDPALRGADAVRELTQLFTTRLGEFVRRYPEQYFWAHRRWKTQPEGGEPASDPTPDGVVDPPAARH